MKVLILTGRFGMGHVSVANSLKEQIADTYKDAEIEVIDLVEYTVPRFSKLIYSVFTFMTKHGSSLYNFLYRQAGKRDENEWTAFTSMCMKRLTLLMEDKGPDVVISTLPLCSLLVSKYIEKKKPVKLVTCITDISSHSEWIQPHTQFYLVGDELVKKQLLCRGVMAESVVVTGIPVGKAFREISERVKKRRAAEEQAAKCRPMEGGQEARNLLIMGGGLGLLPKEPDFYDALDQMKGVRTTVITGKNEKLYQSLAGRYRNVKVVSYTDQVDRYMQEADVVLTKPGGITLFETIFSGKPVLMFAPFLQQEVNNMHFALYHDIGRVLSKKKSQWAQQIGGLMADEGAISSMTERVLTLREQYAGEGLRQVLESCCGSL